MGEYPGRWREWGSVNGRVEVERRQSREVHQEAGAGMLIYEVCEWNRIHMVAKS